MNNSKSHEDVIADLEELPPCRDPPQELSASWIKINEQGICSTTSGLNVVMHWITLSLNLADDAEEVISWLWIIACCHLQYLMIQTQQFISKCWIECVQSQPREEYLSVPMVDGPPQLETLWKENLSEATRCARGSAPREDLGRIGWFCAVENVDEAGPNVGRGSGRLLWEAGAWSWREGGRQPQPMVDTFHWTGYSS